MRNFLKTHTNYLVNEKQTSCRDKTVFNGVYIYTNFKIIKTKLILTHYKSLFYRVYQVLVAPPFLNT